MKPLLAKLIHPLHARFVPGQNALDNIIIAQKMIDTICKAKAKYGGLMLKLDLEKAYNKVEWNLFKRYTYSDSRSLRSILFKTALALPL